MIIIQWMEWGTLFPEKSKMDSWSWSYVDTFCSTHHDKPMCDKFDEIICHISLTSYPIRIFNENYPFLATAPSLGWTHHAACVFVHMDTAFEAKNLLVTAGLDGQLAQMGETTPAFDGRYISFSSFWILHPRVQCWEPLAVAEVVTAPVQCPIDFLVSHQGIWRQSPSEMVLWKNLDRYDMTGRCRCRYSMLL